VSLCSRHLWYIPPERKQKNFKSIFKHVTSAVTKLVNFDNVKLSLLLENFQSLEIAVFPSGTFAAERTSLHTGEFQKMNFYIYCFRYFYKVHVISF